MGSYSHQHSSNPNAVLAHTRVGSPVASPQGIEADGRFKKAGLLSTTPYKPPKRRASDSAGRDKLLCSMDGCKAWPLKDFPYCTGHARSLGLVTFGDGKGFKKVATIGDSD
jgi:hypothetical protein